MKIASLLLSAALLAVAPRGKAKSPPPSPPKDNADAPAPEESSSKKLRTIELTAKSAGHPYLVHTAVGYPVTVDFPEPFASAPVCGDCNAKSSVFHFDVVNDKDAHYFSIKPQKYPGLQDDGSNIPEAEFLTNVIIRLQSGLTLAIDVALSDRAHADTRVTFVQPARSGQDAYVEQQIAKAKRDLDATYALKIDQRAKLELAKKLRGFHQCVSPHRTKWHEQMFVEVTELCRYGSDVAISYDVENRGRTLLDLADVQVTAGSGRNAVPAEDPIRWPDFAPVEFQKTFSGIVIFTLEASDAKTYELTVREQGGRNREVVVGDLSF